MRRSPLGASASTSDCISLRHFWPSLAPQILRRWCSAPRISARRWRLPSKGATPASERAVAPSAASVIGTTVAATIKTRRNMGWSICADMNPRCGRPHLLRHCCGASRRKKGMRVTPLASSLCPLVPANDSGDLNWLALPPECAERANTLLVGRSGRRRLGEAIERRGHDVGEAGGRRQARELGRVEPARLVEFLVEDRLARAPAGGKAQDDEMPLDPALRIADDGFAKAGERNRFDCQPRLLVHLARHGLRERLADLDHASGQGEQAMGWRACAAHHKYLAIAHDGGAHGEVGTLGIGSCVRHGGGLSKSMM